MSGNHQVRFLGGWGTVMCPGYPTNDSGAVMLQTGLNHFAGMDLRMADGAGEERFVSNEAMLVIEEEHGKLFALQ